MSLNHKPFLQLPQVGVGFEDREWLDANCELEPLQFGLCELSPCKIVRGLAAQG